MTLSLSSLSSLSSFFGDVAAAAAAAPTAASWRMWHWAAMIALAAFLLPKIAYILRGHLSRPDHWSGKRSFWLVELIFSSVEWFTRVWHDYEIHGIEHIDADNCLLVGYHSRPTMDVVYAIANLRSASLVSHPFFEVPLLCHLLRIAHFMPSAKPGTSGDSEAKQFVNSIMNGERPVLLLPGGAYECSKPWKDRYKVDWKSDPGYARVLLSEPERPGEKCKIVPFFTNNSEDVFYSPRWWFDYSGAQTRQALTDLRKGKFWILPKLFVFGAVSLGFSALPVPVKLDLYIGKPLTPKKKENSTQFAARVQASLQRMIDKVRGEEERLVSSTGYHPRQVVWRTLSRPVLALYSMLQNMAIFTYLITSVLLLSPLMILLKVLLGVRSMFRQGKKKER
jgi:hypothetical protein